MKRIRLPLFFVVALAALSFTFGHLPVLEIGSPLPKADVPLKDISGREITLSGSRLANGLLVMFSCNTCPYVVKNQERTREIGLYAKQQKVGVVLINSNDANRESSDSYEAMQAYAREQGYAWPYAMDRGHELADAFGASRTPEVFLFNSSGKLVYRGAIDDNPGNAGAVQRQHLKEAIDELVGGKDISVKETRSVGCGIKRKA